jgi:hypothetical protein
MNPLLNLGFPTAGMQGMPQMMQRGGLAPIPPYHGGDLAQMPRNVQPILGGGGGGGGLSGGLMSMLQDPQLQQMLMQSMQQEQPQLQGAGVGQMDVSGLLMPYQPPQIDLSLLGLLLGR